MSCAFVHISCSLWYFGGQSSVMWSICLVILTQLLCGGWVVQPVESQATVNRPTRHTLPPELESGLFGSPVNGGCSSTSGTNNEICDGTSVLNDGIIPALSGVSVPASQWANELFTMRRSGTSQIVVSFEVPRVTHNRMELTVFNCPQLGIYAPQVIVYIAASLNANANLQMVANMTLSDMSCDFLWRYCVQFSGGVGTTNFNLVFPYQNNSDLVFLGEVTFLNDPTNQCDPPEQITMRVTPPLTTDPTAMTMGTSASIRTTDIAISETDSTPPPINPSSSPRDDTVTVIAVVIVVLLVLIALAIILVILCIFLMKRRRKQETDRVQQLQNVVMETKEEQKEDPRYVDQPNDYYSSVDKPPQNGVKLNVATGEVAITDTLYSNPDEVKNDTYSHLRDDKKKELTPVNSGVSDDQYSMLNHSQTDLSRPSPTPQNPVDEGVMYAVPDKKKRSDNTPALPEKSSELIEYLDTKEAQSKESVVQSTPEYSKIESSTRRSGSMGPVTLHNMGSHEFVSSMSSNPLYHPMDIRPLHMKPLSSLPPATGVLEVNAIYAEPLPPPSTHEPEWNPDQNIYESIYSEPLNPSLFMQNREPTDVEELRPYMSIYTVPVVPTNDKPLSVSISNIKEIKHLGDGNFGQVVLAQTVGLTPKDLKLEGDAPYTLVAVKKLKASASNRNRQLFDKEVSFMSRLNHPNVIRLLGVCSEGATPFIMMEYMTNGDLNQYLQGFHSIGDELTTDSAKSISVSTLIYMCTQIASAMQYLASQNFVHRDLATRNCLVGSKDTIKISDFGMSRSLYESQYYVISGHAILPIRWMATECFFGKFSAKTDVWAFGVTMWEIFTLVKERPYNHLEDRAVVEDAVKGANRTLLNRPAQCPENMYEIMRKCWVNDASQRPTFDELYSLLSKN